jgi:hypothetical protein
MPRGRAVKSLSDWGSRRNTYFTTTLTVEELREAVKKSQEKKAAVQLRRGIDRQITMGTTQEPLRNHWRNH